MTSFRRRILYVLATTAILAAAGVSHAGNETRSFTVKLNQKERVLSHWLVNANILDENTKCVPFRPATLILRKKPKYGTVKVRKGVMIETDPKSPCKGKKVRGSTVDYTGTKRGRDTFVVEVVYKQPGYYDHKYGEITYNIRVK